MSEQDSRSVALRASRDNRMREWFGERRWRVCSELSSDIPDVLVRSGEFWVLNGKVFKNPFGNKGTHGYIIQEVDPDTGVDLWNDDGPSRAQFGWIVLDKAVKLFPGSIVEVPPRPYGKPGGVAGVLDRQ
jgi:hypothetical protein